MHTLRSILIIWLLSSALTACTTDPLTQANKAMSVRHVATQAILAMYQNDTDAVFKRMHASVDTAYRADTKRWAYKAQQKAQSKGGIASVRADDVRYSDNQQRAKVRVTVKFNNGETKAGYISLIQTNKQWLLGQ